MSIPAYQYRRDGREWCFDMDGALRIPTGLDFRQIVVKGKVRPGFLPGLRRNPPNELLDLRPDILIQSGQQAILIEVKTVGHELGRHQKESCERLATYLTENGYRASLFFLISAGHESRKDWDLLVSISPASFPFRLLLWEQVLKQVYQQQPESILALCLGDTTLYYAAEERYMKGRD